MRIPPGFFKPDETLETDPDATDMAVGFASGYRVLYTRYKGSWHARLLDPNDRGGVFVGDRSFRKTERLMVEGIAQLPADDQRRAVAS